MQTHRILGLAATAAFFIASVCSAEPAKASATGSGMLKIKGEDGKPAYRTFTFNAVAHRDGTTTGQAEIHNRIQGRSWHLKIDCLSVQNGQVAALSGTVESDSTGEYTGWQAWFMVADMGEGAGSQPDGITLTSFFPGGGPSCTDTWYSDELRPIQAGNVQVR